MAEPNGDRDTRLDRIERALELLIADHEQFRVDHKQLLTAQVLQSEEIDKLIQVTQEHGRHIQEHSRQIEGERIARKESTAALDKRVNDLVAAIGALIARIPPRSLSQDPLN